MWFVLDVSSGSCPTVPGSLSSVGVFILSSSLCVFVFLCFSVFFLGVSVLSGDSSVGSLPFISCVSATGSGSSVDVCSKLSSSVVLDVRIGLS